MERFLEEVVNEIAKRGISFQDYIFVVPNKRAGIFLKKEIIRYKKDTTFLLPKVYGIEDFVRSLIDLQDIDYIQLIFEFYEVYHKTMPSIKKESFEDFIPWASLVLKDFIEIDSNCLPASDFFSYLQDIKEQEHWSLEDNKTPFINKYIEFWKDIGLYYDKLTTHLKTKKLGHSGLLYRTAADQINSYNKTTSIHHIFLGFNALNRSEETIIKTLLDSGKGEIFMDVDKSMLAYKYHNASYFLRKYISEWDYFKSNPVNFKNEYFKKEKHFEIIGASQSVGQAKVLGKILSSIALKDQEKTAVVLGDESLLVPVLQSIPNTIKAVNITMGMPLKSLQLHSFFYNLMETHLTKSKKGFYHKNMMQLISDPAIKLMLPETSKKILSGIKTQNLVYITLKNLVELISKEKEKELINLLFSNWDTASKAITACQQFIEWGKMSISREKDPILITQYFYFDKIFTQLSNFHKAYNSIKTIRTLRFFYGEIVNNQSIDFIGEPLQGLQIMGMLETRCLDFETVIITSVNEGLMPLGKSNSSFIPYDLRSLYQLPTFKERDAIYSYNFYRLIQRAKKIYLIYNTNNEGVGGGEKSRFIQQLIIDKQTSHSITERLAVATIPKNKMDQIKIQKSDEVLQKLREWASHGISPSALTTYIRNPIEFYYNYVLNIKEEAFVEETIAANTLGTIIHNTLEKLYAPVVSEELTTKSKEGLVKNIENEIKIQFGKEYASLNIQQGKNLLIYEVAKRYVRKFIRMQDQEIQDNNVHIISVEDNFTMKFSSNLFNFPIRLRGKIDRIDKVNDEIRILDYKTGKVLASELKINNIETVGADYKFSKAFQVLIYAYLYKNQPNYNNEKLYGSIVSFKNLKAGFLKLHYIENGKFQYLISESCMSEFHQVLENLLKEIFDKSTPFIEKEI